MVIFQIFKADLITSYRVFIDRTFKPTIHEFKLGKRTFQFRFPRFLTVFFIIISLLAINLTINIIEFLDNEDLTNPHILIKGGTFAIFFFFIIFLRVMLYTYRKVLKADELHYIFTIPIRLRSIILGKYLANIVYIFTQILTGFFLVILIMYLNNLNTWIPPLIFLEGVLLLILGCSLGFTIPIFLQVRPLKRKLGFLMAHGLIVAALSIPIQYTPAALRGLEYILLMVLANILLLILVLFSEQILLEAWLNQVSKPFRYILKRHESAAFVDMESSDRIIDEKEMIIAKKDLIFFIREKDVISTVVASVALIIIMFGLFNLIGPHSNIENEYSTYVYPMIIGLSLFLAAVLQCSLIGLASISMEGKPFWILKSMPINGKTVLKGKSMAIFTLAFPTVVLISVPLPILDGFPLLIGLFFFVEAFVLVVAFTGIGIWGGAKIPNFDETMRNMPDLMSQFSITFASAFIAVFLFGIPAGLLTISHPAGFLAALDALGWAFVLFLYAIDKGQKAYEEIESDLYM